MSEDAESIVVGSERDIAIQSADLDAEVARVHELTERLSAGYWELGNAVLSIRESGSWRARRENGRQAYSSFEQFCSAELGFSMRTSYRLMAVASLFTREDVEHIGSTKLAFVSQFTDSSERARLLEIARNGGSKADLAREAMRMLPPEKRDRPIQEDPDNDSEEERPDISNRIRGFVRAEIQLGKAEIPLRECHGGTDDGLLSASEVIDGVRFKYTINLGRKLITVERRGD